MPLCAMLTLYPLFSAYNRINSQIARSSSMMTTFACLCIHRSPHSLYTLHFTPRVASLYEQNVNTEETVGLVHLVFLFLEDTERSSGSFRFVGRKGYARPSTHANEL